MLPPLLHYRFLELDNKNKLISTPENHWNFAKSICCGVCFVCSFHLSKILCKKSWKLRHSNIPLARQASQTPINDVIIFAASWFPSLASFILSIEVNWAGIDLIQFQNKNYERSIYEQQCNGLHFRIMTTLAGYLRYICCKLLEVRW